MEKGWEKIYTTEDTFKAELLRTMLKEHGIECVVMNKKDSAYIMIGEVEIFVKHDDVLRALNLIRKHDESA